jgi:two-component system chemotaxis response regulator CheY
VELVLEDSGLVSPPGDLALLDRLLARSGGSVAHEASAEGGNRYRVVLPGIAGRQPSRAPALARGTGDRADELGDLTVLVCDDDAVVRDLVVRLVERAGMRALGAATGDEALATVERAPVDVVMADYRMATMTGAELFAALTARVPSLRRRFVLMSGDPGDEGLVTFARAEGLTVLEKPFATATLPATLREVAGR